MKLDDEKAREQLLKRFIPALVIIVVYFVFIKGAIDKDLKAAEQQYTDMAGKGISAEVLPELNKRKSEIAASVVVLNTEHKKIQKELDKHTRYLEGTGNVNKTLETLSSYFTENLLHVTQENWVEPSEAATLPKSFNAVKLWLKSSKNKSKSTPAVPAKKTLKGEKSANRLREIQFYGSYQNTYEAMVGFAERKFKVIPVSISMALPEESSNASKSGLLKWVLKLWI